MAIGALLKRQYWLVGAATVVACSALAATTVSHLIEATALAESDRPVHLQLPHRPAAAATAAATAAAASSGSPDQLVARNIFCSECVPPLPDTAGAPATDPDRPPDTALPLRLVATIISPLEARTFATIRNTTSSRQGAYSVGDEIPGAGRIVRIVGVSVDFENQGSRQIERIPLFRGDAARAAPAAPSLPAPGRRERGAGRTDLLSEVDAGVRKLDDSHYEVDRALVAKLLASPAAAARGGRIVPSVKDGRPDGFKLYAVRRDSVYSRIGLRSGDTIHAVNGFELTSMDKALEVYTKVRESSRLSVSVSRRGKPVTLEYTIR